MQLTVLLLVKSCFGQFRELCQIYRITSRLSNLSEMLGIS